MQRRHLRREYVTFRHIGNQNPTKAGINLCRRRHIFSPTVSPCLAKGKHSSLPYPLTPTKPAFTVVFYPFYLSPILSIVLYLSPPPLSFAIFSLHIEYLLFVLLGSVVVRRLSICTNLYECAFPCYYLAGLFPSLYTPTKNFRIKRYGSFCYIIPSDLL